jgi:hypothetical protein
LRIRSSFPIAAIAASFVGAVVTILILVALFYSRRKRRRSSSVPTVNTSLAPRAQEKEAVQYSGFASLLPIQGIGGWDVPPIAASASAELALDPFADPVPMPDEPFNASPVLVVPPLTREVYDVSVPDPFVDPPALVATSEEELPSRLSKASSYDVPNPRASVTSSNVRLFSLITQRINLPVLWKVGRAM